jgi:hypothetical protein
MPAMLGDVEDLHHAGVLKLGGGLGFGEEAP